MSIKVFFVAVVVFPLLLSIGCNNESPLPVVHVSIDGDDGNSGASGQPLRTLYKAKQKVRELRASGMSGDIEVIVHGGTYYLDKVLMFTPEDSAPEGSYTIYKAADGEEPVLSGGKPVNNWQKLADYPEYLPEVAKGNVWVTELDWLNEDNRFHALMRGERFLKRARSGPINIFTKGLKPHKHQHMDEMYHRTHFYYDTEQQPFRNWENISDIELYTQPTKKWLVNYLPLKQVDQEAGKVTLLSPATYSLSLNPGYIENAIDYLDEPGEWVVNTQTKKLYYWPESEQPETDILITYLDEIIRVEGVTDASLEGANEQPVKGLVFEGLTFSHGDRQRWEADDIGIQHDWDMWDKDNGLIRFRSAEDSRVSNCKFINTAGDGVRLDLYAQNVAVETSHFENLGGVGVLLAGYGPGLKDVNHHNRVSHNTITKTGQIFLHSPAVFVWQSGHNRINNNHVYDLGYTGMVFAGVRRRFFHRLFDAENPFATFTVPAESREHIPTVRWGEISLDHGIENWDSYEPFMHTRGNIIEYNEIHDCMKLLHDGNAIYMSANGNGNQINYNVVYNHPKGASIRTDDDAHGNTLTGNLVFGTISNLGIRIKGLNEARNNFLHNAYLTTGKAGNTCDANSVFKNNVVYHSAIHARFPYHKALEMVKGEYFDNNLYFHSDESLHAEKEKRQLKISTEEQDKHSLFANPLFVNIDEGNFSLESESPALGLGTLSLPADFLEKVGPSHDPFMGRFQKNKKEILTLRPRKK